MGRLKWGTAISIVAVFGVAGSLAWFNPDQEAFEDYATGQLSSYLEQQLCGELAVPMEQLTNLSCDDLLATHQGLFYEVIHTRTQHYNLVFFSLYRTTLALPSFGLLPTYQIDTLGVLGRFYTINVSQTR